MADSTFKLDRRGFLALGTIAVPALARIPTTTLGAQLFSLTQLLDRDLEGTLTALRTQGFQDVETLGALGREPAELRRMLDRAGLRSSAQNLSPGTLWRDVADMFAGRQDRATTEARWAAAYDISRIDEIIDEAVGRAKVLGQQHIVWQLSWEEGDGLEKARTMAAAFGRAGRRCADVGLRFSFHHHWHEFALRDGHRPIDLILAKTDPKTVGLELDVYWAMRGGVDPVAFLRTHAARIHLVHLKDGTATEPTRFGAGSLDLPAIYAAARTFGVERCFIEYEGSATPSMMGDARRLLQPR